MDNINLAKQISFGLGLAFGLGASTIAIYFFKNTNGNFELIKTKKESSVSHQLNNNKDHSLENREYSLCPVNQENNLDYIMLDKENKCVTHQTCINEKKRDFTRLTQSVPPKQKFKTMAELLKDFEKKVRLYTPPTKPKGQWKPTRPIAPNLSAVNRKRVINVLSEKEKEEQIAENIKKNLFKATPFNRSIYESCGAGIKRIPSKPITKAKGMVFASDKRLELRKSKISIHV